MNNDIPMEHLPSSNVLPWDCDGCNSVFEALHVEKNGSWGETMAEIITTTIKKHNT